MFRESWSQVATEILINDQFMSELCIIKDVDMKWMDSLTGITQKMLEISLSHWFLDNKWCLTLEILHKDALFFFCMKEFSVTIVFIFL